MAASIFQLVVPRSFMLVAGMIGPAVAGAVWGVCFARISGAAVHDAGQSRHWIAVHAAWGAVSGPLMLWSQFGSLMLPRTPFAERVEELWRLTMHSPFGPASITLIAAIALVVARSGNNAGGKKQWARESLPILGLVLVPIIYCGATFIINRDGLEGIEFDCKDALLKSDAMVGVTDLRIDRHFNWWEKTYYMSWVLLGAKSDPYERPEVTFSIRFKRQDDLLHSASVTCKFAIVPDSGHPPSVRFEDIDVSWEQFFDPEQNTWARWPPKE